jgi:hypothetical protein
VLRPIASLLPEVVLYTIVSPFKIARANPTICNSFIGVKSFDVSLETQTATVITEPSVSYDAVLSTVKKTGKKVNTGEADGNVMNV